MDIKYCDSERLFQAFSLCAGDPQVLIVDLRGNKEFKKRHIMLAYNVRLSNNGKILADYSRAQYKMSWQQDCWWGMSLILYGDVGLDKDHPVAVYLQKQNKCRSVEIYKHGFQAFESKYPFLCCSSVRPGGVNYYPSQIIPQQLYLGHWGHAQDVSRLKDLNIYWVYTIHNSPENLSLPKEFKHTLVECADVSSAPISNHFDDCYRFIEDAIKSGSACLVHCGAGVSRSATLVTAYLMRKMQWSAQTALQYVKQRRSLAQPNDGFWRTLCALEEPLGIANRSDPNASFGGLGADAPELSKQAVGEKPEIRIIDQEYFEDMDEEENNNNKKRKHDAYDTNANKSHRKNQREELESRESNREAKRQKQENNTTKYPFVMDVLKDGRVISQVKVDDLQIHQRFFIGRAKPPASDLYLQHESISRRHACIQRNGVNDVTITDLQSGHGTNLDGVWIRAKQQKLIKVGSVLKFGGSTRNYKVVKI